MSLRRPLPDTVPSVRGLVRDESGQVLPIITVAMLALCSICALAIDVAHATFTYRALQTATDATALAAAQAVPTVTSSSQIIGPGGTVETYSAKSGGYNASTALPNVTVTSQLLCLNSLLSQGIPCTGNVPYNAVQVTQTMSMKTYFAGVLGKPTVPLVTISTAAIRGGAVRPTNLALLVDSTLSMAQYDSDCGNTQMQCALNGVQILLKHLTPCPSYQTTCTITNGVSQDSFDRVALFTFPNLVSSTVYIDTSCTTPIPDGKGYDVSPLYGNYVVPQKPAWGGIPTATTYSLPSANSGNYSPGGGNSATYQVTGYLSDYRVSDSATTLNANSALAKAVGGVSNCGGMLPSNYDGVYGTYYAGAIYAAQSSLKNIKSSFPNADNVMIILGDGDSHAFQNNYGLPVFDSSADASGSYPSYVGQCSQAVTAAKAATAAGTMVYTIAYGAGTVGCGTDALAGAYPGILPCNTMSKMASAPQMFYSDYKQSGSFSTCVASQPVTSLNDIFTSIANDLTQPRLIPTPSSGDISKSLGSS